MDSWLARHRCARMLSTSLTLIFEASEYAREGQRANLATQLEHLSEELIDLHRQALDLPPKGAPPADEAQEQFPW